MDELSHRLDELGEAVAEVADRTADPGVLQQARRRWLAPAEPQARRPRYRVALAMAAAVVAGIAITQLWTMDRRPVTTFQIGEPPTLGEVGAWVAANDDGALPLRFSEGSALDLEPGTRVRVTETTPDGAALLIERGAVRAAITHAGPETQWTLRAGPFAVQVLGTEFRASWNPAEEIFELAVHDGTVQVAGPLLPPDRRVAAGERLFVSVRQQRMDLSTAQPATAAAPDEPATDDERTSSAEQSDEEPADDPTQGAGGARATGSGAATANAAGSWQKLAADRKYREAMAALEQVGFEQQVQGASAGELRTLADIARFAGQPARAQQALLQLRQRFGARGHSAFLLGRIALSRGASGDAVRWFETYLREQPRGPLAEQALGRILEIQRHGSAETARRAAERYLARYPNGAYAALARSVLPKQP